jgi:iron complex transport system substrate-binding protein
MKIQDQLGREIELKKTPERIISLVPSQTELLVDLGLEKSILGITQFCVHPPYLKKIKTRVGGTKKVNFRKLRELEPDIILCNREENTKVMVEELEKIAPVHISDVVSLEDTCRLIESYGDIFNRRPLSRTLSDSIRIKASSLKKLASKSKQRKVAYFIWNDPIMVAGKHTFIDEMLKLNNFVNVFNKDRYPETSIEELKSLDIDLCMLSSEPFPFKDEHISKFEDLAKDVRIVDGEYFSWYGSRLLEAIAYFKSFHS